MKTTNKRIIMIALLLVMTLSTSVYASTTNNFQLTTYTSNTSINESSYTFYVNSPYYVINEAWIQGNFNAELKNNTVYVSLTDFKNAFNCYVEYNYQTLSIYIKLGNVDIWQGLNSSALFINNVSYPAPAPYISSAYGNPVMVPVETYTSTIGLTGKYEKTMTYAPGQIVLRKPVASSNNGYNTYSSTVYYPGTIIPDYTYVTGIPLKDTYYAATGIVYRYPNTEYGEYYEMVDYMSFLVKNGWVHVDKNINNVDSLTYSFKKNDVIFAISFQTESDEIWVAYLY